MCLRSLLFLIYLICTNKVLADNCLLGCPTGVYGQEIIRANYTMRNNGTSKFADWVAYHVTPLTIDGPSRNRNWKSDPLIDFDETLEPKDYTGANAELGTDRGHQVPLASFSNTSTWVELNYLSNITPQNSDLNQGPWVGLESAIRDYVRSSKQDVYVTTGPLYEYYFGMLPGANESHDIPSGYFKVVITNVNGFIEASAFIMEQDISRNDSYCWFETSVDDVETRSNLNIMPFLPSYKHYPVETQSYGLSSELGC